MTDPGLLRTTDALARLARDAEALLARVAGEIARRSPTEAGKDGLAKQQGFANPAKLIATATGGAVAGAAKLVFVGQATAPRQSLTGERMPAVHPHVAAALDGGTISVDAAAAITGMLDRVAQRAEPAQADAMEKILAERAAELPFDLLLRLIRQAETRLDQDGIEPKEDELRAERSLHLREDRHGMLHLTAILDPESAAPVKVAIESIVTATIRNRRPECARPDPAAGAVDGPGALLVDERTVPQLQADALAMIARHVIGCGRMPSAPAMAVIVRTSLDTLTTGIGHGTIDRLDQPVSASTIRKMAATAGVIPAVLDGDSLPLDLGRDNRLFSWAQRVALGERDGGCACCGLDVRYVEAHHIDWWKRDDGPTDLTNGVLLCPPCHTRIHQDGWRIRVAEATVWFTPPPHVDPDQKPRLGGKTRYTLPTLDAA
jgi:5-methylcytosine-specific restriction protein A